MKISRLEIKGFKSFPDKTVFEFKPGITSIVGPNGCGKSNVLEAIRWVMGEQRVRILRGKKMEDVIFNGSETRKPVGLAEVRLVLSNNDGLSPPSMAEYDEVMIARRLFRDGESHYEINNVACRLGDITDFFLDTGVGRNSYAIIEQGRVDQVIASKPEDRRALIEEAAGINRYKARRETALKKLEQTSVNLERISDVIKEVRRQSASLKRQAAKAERYRGLNERLKELDLALHSHKCRDLQQQWAGLTADLEVKRTLLLEQESRSSSLAADLEKTRVAALDTEKSLKELHEARHETDVELASLRASMDRDRTRIVQLRDRGNRGREEKRALEEKRRCTTERLEELDQEKRSIESEVEEARKEVAQASSDAARTERSLGEARKNLDRLKEDLFRSLQEAAQQRNRKESLTRRRTEIEALLMKIAVESENLTSSAALDRDEEHRLAAAAAQVTEARKICSDTKIRLVKASEEKSREIASLRADTARIEKKLAASKAKLESLEEMQRNYAGYDGSVRFLMREDLAQTESGLLGPVAEMIEIPPEYQKALAAALGDRVGCMVVSSVRDGVEAAERLKDAKAGRSTFIPLRPRSIPVPCEPEAPGGLIPLREVVSLREGCQDLGEFLFSNCFVVADLGQAAQIWEKNGSHIDLVTLEGETISRHGEITGGSQDRRQDEVFEKRREIAALKDEINVLEEAVEGLQSSLRDKENMLAALSVESQEIDRKANELRVEEVRVSKDLERLQGQVTTSERRLQVLDLEKEQLCRENGEVEAETARFDESLSRLEDARKALAREKEQTVTTVEEFNRLVQEGSLQTGELRVRLAHLEERAHSVDREHRSVLDTVSQLERRVTDLLKETEDQTTEERRLEEQLIQSEAHEKHLMQQHESASRGIDELKSKSDELSRQLKLIEGETSRTDQSTRELKEVVHGLEMESVRVEQMLNGLVEKILERYLIDPRTVECSQSPPDEHAISDLRAKLEALGEVNLAAIAESRQVEERFNFLSEQEEDLKKAVESLYSTINTIDRTTKDRFREAFDGVNEKFQEIFPFLFGGGEARLELTEEEDLLETGVDIMTRPPGKRIQNMDLLSGGEKALTAVALIFSIFLTRPSPFCLLDEVDAPLDDANLVRFNEMLKRISDRTQFLVITHNKRTMEEADSLYGVTMEEPGSSSVVSVQFAG